MQDRLFDKLSQQPGKPPDAEYLDSLPLLTSIIYESLRLFPPIGQHSLCRPFRRRHLPPRGHVRRLQLLLDGPRPRLLGPRRRRLSAKSLGVLAARYTQGVQAAEDACRVHHFSRRAARMSGEHFAALQLKATLYTLVTSLRWRLDRTWLDRMTPVSKTGWR